MGPPRFELGSPAIHFTVLDRANLDESPSWKDSPGYPTAPGNNAGNSLLDWTRRDLNPRPSARQADDLPD